MQSVTDALEPAATEAMDLTSPGGPSMAPPGTSNSSSPELEPGGNTATGNMDNHVGGQGGTGTAAMAAAQGPKTVQNAFVHKLYSMLEDKSIEHLISWSNTQESFVMSPSTDFSKVLAQYFKHTNISSFVRQLNMYGFHKVSDVFHGGSDSALWEFRHGNGNFRKGDLYGLREIKRRASKPNLTHREPFSAHKPVPAHPGTPAEQVLDPMEQRMVYMEQTVYRMSQYISRTEDSLAGMGTKCQTIVDSLVRCHEWNNTLSSHVQSLAPAESSLCIGASNMQKEIARHLETVRSLCSPQDSLVNGRQPHFGNMSLDPHPSLSPRHNFFDESRRSSIQTLEPPPSGSFRSGYVGQSAHLPTSPRTYGMAHLAHLPHHNDSPNSVFNRPTLPPHRPSIPSVTDEEGPNLARRHTSADIRQHGWPPNLPPVPSIPPSRNYATNSTLYPSANSTSVWLSSPNRPPTNLSHSSHNEHQHLRDQLASYERSASSARRHAIPPPISLSEASPSAEHVGWSSRGGGGSGPSSDPKVARLGIDLSSAPATRRSSMASNVHSLLNPTERSGVENDEDEVTGHASGTRAGGGDERKRKRL